MPNEIPKSATLVAGGPFPITRESILAASLAALTALNPLVLYIGMIGIAADTPGTLYIWDGLLWNELQTGGGSGALIATAAATANVAALTGTGTFDGIPLVVDDRLFLSDLQTNPVERGLWQIQAGPWIRPPEFDVGDSASCALVIVQQGLSNQFVDQLFQCTSDPPATIGTSPLSFKKVIAAGFGINTAGGLVAIDTTTAFVGVNAWTGNHEFNGNVSLGNATSDDIAITGRVTTDIVPKLDNTNDLGTTALRWKTVHVGPGSIVVHNDTTNTAKITLGFNAADASLSSTGGVALRMDVSVGPTANPDINFVAEVDHTLQVLNSTTAGVTGGNLTMRSGAGATDGAFGGNAVVNSGNGGTGGAATNGGRSGDVAIRTGTGGAAGSLNPGGSGNILIENGAPGIATAGFGGGVAGSIFLTGSAGGVGSAAQSGGPGSSIFAAAGPGGVNNGGGSGAAGVLVFASGAGSHASGGFPASAGGSATFSSGAGGSGTTGGGGVGGQAGGLAMFSGSQGGTNGAGNAGLVGAAGAAALVGATGRISNNATVSGAGGSIVLQSGFGGNAGATAGAVGGVGGSASILAGAGGDSTATVLPGAGGGVTIQAGTPGTNNGAGFGFGGDVFIDGGNAAGATAQSGLVDIGALARTVKIGNPASLGGGIEARVYIHNTASPNTNTLSLRDTGDIIFLDNPAGTSNVNIVLDATNGGGRNFKMMSTGSAAAWGTGRWTVFDNGYGKPRLAIDEFGEMTLYDGDVGPGPIFTGGRFNCSQEIITGQAWGAILPQLGASIEKKDVYWNLARTVTWNTGAIATQRAVSITAPTYAFVGASTITNAATVAISNAPTAGANATITNAYALWVEAGNTRLGGNLQVDGVIAGLDWVVTSIKVANYTAVLNELVRVDPTGGAFTVTLPTAVGITGKQIIVKNVTASGVNVTIDGAGAETIDDALTFILNTARQSVTLASDGANWMVI